MPTTPDTDPVDDAAAEGAAAFRCAWPKSDKDPTPFPGNDLPATKACGVLDASYVAYYPIEDQPDQVFGCVICERHVLDAVRRGWIVSQPYPGQTIGAVRTILDGSAGPVWGAPAEGIRFRWEVAATGDQELNVMSLAADAVSALPGDAQARTVMWLSDRFGVVHAEVVRD